MFIYRGLPTPFSCLSYFKNPVLESNPFGPLCFSCDVSILPTFLHDGKNRSIPLHEISHTQHDGKIIKWRKFGVRLLYRILQEGGPSDSLGQERETAANERKTRYVCTNVIFVLRPTSAPGVAFNPFCCRCCCCCSMRCSFGFSLIGLDFVSV